MPVLWQSRCKNVQMCVFAKLLILKAKLAASSPKEGRCRFWQLKINKLCTANVSMLLFAQEITCICICLVMCLYSDKCLRTGVYLYLCLYLNRGTSVFVFVFVQECKGKMQRWPLLYAAKQIPLPQFHFE